MFLTLTAGMMGAPVSTLHQDLLERGALPVQASAEVRAQWFGPITTAAVKSFQAAQGLPPDGIVGPKTWDALAGISNAPAFFLPLDVTGATPVGAAALAAADAELRAGVAEVPPGSNRGPRVDLYLLGLGEDARWLIQYRKGGPKVAADGFQGAPWCGRFARFCVDLAVQRLACPSPIAGWGDLASAWKWRDAAVRAGAWRTEPAPGRVGVIIVEGDEDVKPHGHLILIARPVEDGQVWTREGNSGDRVAARRRPVAGFAGFVET